MDEKSLSHQGLSAIFSTNKSNKKSFDWNVRYPQFQHDNRGCREDIDGALRAIRTQQRKLDSNGSPDDDYYIDNLDIVWQVASLERKGIVTQTNQPTIVYLERERPAV